jgi:hypothetical protein
MPQWGANTNDESKPKNLTAEEKSRVFADTRGWVITRPDGNEEVLVAIRNLSGGATTNKLAEASIGSVYFAANSYSTGTTGSVWVSWNEKVSKTATPTLLVRATTSGGGTSNLTASYAAGIGTNKMRFDFTVPSTTGTVLTLLNQTISGTITDAGSGNAADKSLTTSLVVGAALDGGSTSVTTTV